MNTSGLAGFLLAKVAEAFERRSPKDRYDIAFVLLHHDAGGPKGVAELVVDAFAGDLRGVRVAIDGLRANFAESPAQGPSAYAGQLSVDHPEIDDATARDDSVIAVETFHRL